MDRSTPGKLLLLPAGLLLLLAAWVHLSLLMSPRFPVDDAFISFQYSRNLASGNGLVFNEGERIEGYSNFLWVALIAGSMYLGLAPDQAARLLSLASVACIFWCILRGVAKDGSRRQSTLWSVAVAFVVVFSPHIALNVLSGLEGPALAACLSLAILFLVQDRILAGAVALLLCSLLRPEGIALSVVVVLVYLSSVLADRRVPMVRRSLRVFALGLALPYALYSALRVLYFGHLVPNTIVAKRGLALESSLGESLAIIGDFATTYAPLLTMVLIGPILTGLRWGERRILLPLTAIFALFGINLFIAHGDPYEGMSRYLIAVIPLACFAAAGLFGESGSSGPVATWRKAPLVLLLGIQFFFLVVRENSATKEARAMNAGKDLVQTVRDGLVAFVRPNSWDSSDPAFTRTQALYDLASWLAANADAGDVVATPEIGIVGYHSGLRVLDMFGLIENRSNLTDAVPGAKLGAEQILDRAPKYVAFKLWMPDMVRCLPAARSLVDSWRFRQGYDPEHSFPGGSWALILFKRREAPRRRVTYDLLEDSPHPRRGLLDPSGFIDWKVDDKRVRIEVRDALRLLSDTDEEILLPAMQQLARRPVDRSDPRFAGLVRDWLERSKSFLFHHPYTHQKLPLARYELELPTGAALHFAMGAMRHNYEGKKSGARGVRYEVRVGESEAGMETVFSSECDPTRRREDRGWVERIVDLKPWEGRRVFLDLIVEPGSGAQTILAVGGWGQPQIVETR